MTNNVLIQVAMMGLAGAIGYLYIYPTFLSIGQMQDDIVRYQNETKNVTVVNDSLSNVVEKAKAISGNEQRRLERYIPAQIDDVAVPRDVQAIATAAGVIISDISQPAVAAQQSDTSNLAIVEVPQVAPLTLEVSGTYEQIKTLLLLLEQNDYPLSVSSLSLGAAEGGFINASFGLETYQFVQPSLIP